MSEPRQAPDLRPLESKHEILSELRAGDESPTYIARDRERGDEVLITVARAHGGDNNALAHFASDTQLLSTLVQPSMPRVLGGQWLGTDAFAVIRERIQGTSLHELLSTDERLPDVRIATVLQAVNGLLDWARTMGVVHRGVTPANVLMEERTDRVLVSLSPTLIPIEGVPDAPADARQIGVLAAMMLAGSELEADQLEKRLDELRPDLAARVRSAILTMVQAKNGEAAPDVSAFIAVVAMAGPLKDGEVEVERLKTEIAEAQRVEREKWEAEQRACEARNEEQARAFAAERVELEQMTQRVKEQFAALDARRVEQERLQSEESARLAAARAEIDQLKAEQEQKNFEGAAALRESAALRAVDEERVRATGSIPSVDTPRADAAPKAERESLPVARESVMQKAQVMAASRRRWLIPGAAAVGLVVLVAIAVAVGHRNRAEATAKPVPPPIVAAGKMPKGGFLSQSAGAVAPRTQPPFALPGSPPASTQPMTAADSVAANLVAKPRPRPRPRPAPEPEFRVDSTNPPASGSAMLFRDSLARDSAALRDTIRRDSLVVRDSFIVRDGTRRDRLISRDSLAKRDSLMKRDTVRRDTTVRGDTLRPIRPPSR